MDRKYVSVVEGEQIPRKPFDKKKWREKKYSKHQKIEEWQERRKKAALHKYHKVLRKEGNISQHSLPSLHERQHEKDSQPTRYQQAMLKYERKRQERENEREKAKQAAAERKAAQERANALRRERQLRFRKTRKGQPVMKDRLEFLLERIQNLE